MDGLWAEEDVGLSLHHAIYTMYLAHRSWKKALVQLLLVLETEYLEASWEVMEQAVRHRHSYFAVTKIVGTYTHQDGWKSRQSRFGFCK